MKLFLRKGATVSAAMKEFSCKRVVILFIFLTTLLLCGGRTHAAVNVVQKTASAALPKGNLVKNEKGVRYKYAKGEYARDKWHKIGSNYYYFASNSYAKTGWFTYKNQKYYASTNGRLYISKWLTKKGKTYYFKNDGAMSAGIWISKNSKIYRFRTDGTLIKSMAYRVNSKIYYADKNGVRIKNKWVNVGTNRYYYGKDGARVVSKWVSKDGKYYYLQSDGSMARNKVVGKYVVDDKGVRHLPADKYIFVGDSRVVGMEMSCPSDNTTYIGRVSMGYDWLVSTAGPRIESMLRTEPNSKVILCFGVNDIDNCSKYIAYYKKLISMHPTTFFYFMAVNPLDPAKYSSRYVSNATITRFNTQLKNEFGPLYIDTYTWLQSTGFESSDGLHYSAATYQKLYTYTLGKI